MDKLADLIKVRLGARNLGNSANSAEVIFKANNLIDGYFNGEKGMKAYKLENGTLFVGVSNSVLSQEFWGVQEDLLSELQKCFGEKKILRIRTKSLTIE